MKVKLLASVFVTVLMTCAGMAAHAQSGDNTQIVDDGGSLKLVPADSSGTNTRIGPAAVPSSSPTSAPQMPSPDQMPMGPPSSDAAGSMPPVPPPSGAGMMPPPGTPTSPPGN